MRTNVYISLTCTYWQFLHFYTRVAVEIADIAWCPAVNQSCYTFAMLVESGSLALMEVKGSSVERLAVAKGIGASASELYSCVLLRLFLDIIVIYIILE